MSRYGQFCPVAKAMEILDERWTLLVLRELLSGSTHFNELRRGVPKMSPALLSKRLRSLARAGLVERTGHGQHVGYTLTPSGQDLMGVVQAIGVWGLRWMPRLGDEDYDPHLLMWDLRRTVPADRWPAGRTVVELRLSDVDPRQRSWWLVVTDGNADLCDADPGHEVTAIVLTDLRTLTRIWRGEQSWESAQRQGTVDVLASSEVRRSLPGWLGRSQLADLAAVTP